MKLFGSVKDKNHCCGVDNLYISAKFCKDAYMHPQRILLYGIARKSGRRLPVSVVQEEKATKSKQKKVRGTVKAAKLTGDPDCPNLLAVSVYDTKPVHFLSAAAESIKWREKKREVYNCEVKKLRVMKFLRLDINDD